MIEYNNLISALQSFEEDWLFDIGIEGCKASLLRQIDNSQLDIDLLKEEYFDSLSDHRLSWKELAIKSCLFSDVDVYSNWEIRSIIEYYLEDIFHPNNTFSMKQKEKVLSRITYILKSKNDWVGLKDLLSLLNDDFPSIKAYHLFCYKEYFDFDLKIKKENRDKLWIVDFFRLTELDYPA